MLYEVRDNILGNPLNILEIIIHFFLDKKPQTLLMQFPTFRAGRKGMLRRIPTTPLVCLVVLLFTITANYAIAEDPQEALEILLKPEGATSQVKKRSQATARYRTGRRALPVRAPYPPRIGFRPITKVKAPPRCAVGSVVPSCVLPKPYPRQWQFSVQAIFARTRGTIAWPRQCWQSSWGQENLVDLNDLLGIPAHEVVPEFTLRYQFRCNWAFRYSLLGGEFAGGQNDWWASGNQQYCFGPNTSGFGSLQGQQSKWEHLYHRTGLVYDAIKTCSSVTSVFWDWVHTDDKISVACSQCGGNQTRIFSKSGDSMIVGLEFQRCLKTAYNGGSLTSNYKAGFIFYDNVEGWDVQMGLRYSIPLGCGRWGYVEGGYRFVEVKKSQPDFLWTNAIEGGFVEASLTF
jgi:hypothetical protein